MEAVKIYVATCNGQINSDRFRAGDEFKYIKELDSYSSPFIKNNIPREVMEKVSKDAFKEKESNENKDSVINAIVDMASNEGVPDSVMSLLYSIKKRDEERLKGSPSAENEDRLKSTVSLIEKAYKLNDSVKKRKEFEKLFGFKPEPGVTIQPIPTELAWRAQRVKLLRFSLQFENVVGDVEGTKAELAKHEKWITSKLQGKMTIEELIEGADRIFN